MCVSMTPCTDSGKGTTVQHDTYILFLIRYKKKYDAYFLHKHIRKCIFRWLSAIASLTKIYTVWKLHVWQRKGIWKDKLVTHAHLTRNFHVTSGVMRNWIVLNLCAARWVLWLNESQHNFFYRQTEQIAWPYSCLITQIHFLFSFATFKSWSQFTFWFTIQAFNIEENFMLYVSNTQ